MLSDFTDPLDEEDVDPITVEKMIEMLQKIPDQQMVVCVDGCDCSDDAGGVVVDGDYVYIVRADHVYNYPELSKKNNVSI
jgi:hypothetical protein